MVEVPPGQGTVSAVPGAGLPLFEIPPPSVSRAFGIRGPDLRHRRSGRDRDDFRRTYGAQGDSRTKVSLTRTSRFRSEADGGEVGSEGAH